MSQTNEEALADPLEQTAHGKTAYQAYCGLMENEKDDFSWAMLSFALSLMAYDEEMRIALARYALSGAPYNRELFAMGTFGFTKMPGTLAEWLKLVERKRGIAPDARQVIGDFLKDLTRREANGEPAAPEPGVREWAARSLTLDMLRDMELGEAVARIGPLAENPATAAEGVRALALLPDPNAGKRLRRACRSAETAPAVKTKALLAMRWIGMEGKAKVAKAGREYTVDLDDPNLQNDLPPALMPVYDWVAIWLLRAEGMIGDAGFAAYAERGEPFPPELFDQTRAIYASPAMEQANRWLMDVYLFSYPDLPVLADGDKRAWGEALLSLLREAGLLASSAGEAAPPLAEPALAAKERLAEAIRG